MSALAVFDLDNTLIDCDSDVCWAEFLGEEGVLRAEDAETRQKFYRDYVSGCLNIDEFLRFQLAPLARFSRERLDDMHRRFMARYILPHITSGARELVREHREQGDELLIISSTNEFIITPIARELGIDNVIGVRLETDGEGRFTGRYLGTPSFGAGKPVRLNEWLAARGQDLRSFDCSYFYSDSHNDLPLLRLVRVPVAVNPDERLAAHAREHGWRVLYLTEKHHA